MTKAPGSLAFLAFFACAVAVAQTPPSDPLQSFTTVDQRLKVDDDARIRQFSGGALSGRVVRIATDEVVLKGAGGERHVPAADIGEITVRHGSAGRGALIGAATGLLSAGLSRECRHNESSGIHDSCGEVVAFESLLGAGAGALIGQLWQRHFVVYRVPAGRVFFAPAVSPHTIGIEARLHW